ncbi:MAG: rpsA 1 [Gemmataceae bacterium]|nr:rpsA 1 [Gemmataceae bacterium]
MVNRNLLRQINVTEEDVHNSFAGLGEDESSWDSWLTEEPQVFESNKIVSGRVLEIRGDDVVIDIGYKSEGVIKLDEWRDEGAEGIAPPKAGDTVEVLLETVEGEDGAIALSYRKAKRQKEWNAILAKHKEGDVVAGKVIKKIKGGLLVNIGVNVFLPASQVDIRRPQSIDEYIDRTIECVILKIDEQRRNIVVSRRKLIEDRRRLQKDKLLAELEIGQIRKGVVKNIAEFGAFVDLGGIDGLLHITDMGWHRVTNPHDVVKIDQELEVYILHIDREKEKIALSLKHKTPSPWQNIEQKYPVNTRHTGEVVNIMPYGAFVKLEPGIEGLVHISEMSWVKRIADPKELVQIGDKVEVQVLNINHDKKEISLGMKQCQANPWGEVAKKYPPGTVITGTVRNLTNYGAFIEIEEGIDGLLHVSDMSWTRKVSNPSEVVQKGQKITCQVLSVDQERKRVALGLKQMASDPWEGDIPGRFKPGQKVTGKVTKLTNFGVFVELEPGLEGLLHISELSDDKVESPEEVVKVGDDVEVKVLRVDTKDRKVGLSMKNVDDPTVPDEIPDMPTEATAATAGTTGTTAATAAAAPAGGPKTGAKDQKKEQLRGGTGAAGPLFQMPAAGEEE